MKNQNNYTTTINNTYQKAISKLLIVFVFIMGSIQMKAATITSTATGGTWATGSTWVGGVAPATGDAVIIATTGTNSVSIGANLTQTAAGSVTINNGAILNMTTTGVTASLGALTINTGGKFNCSRALTVQGATNISGTVTFASTSGTSRAIAFTGNVTLNAGAVWTEPATGNGANNTYAFAGNFTNNATTFNALGTGNHTFSGTAKTISGATATTFKALVINGTVTNNLAAHLTVSTGLTGTGTLTQGTNSYLNLVGTATITTLTATAAGDTVNYSGVAQTAKVTTYINLTLSGSLAKTFATTPTVNGVLSMEGTATVTVTTGVVTYGGSATLKYNTATARTATTEEWITPFSATGGIVIANTGAITMPGASVLNANVPLTINAGATLTPGANLLTVGGNFTINGAFTSGSGGVTIASNAATQAISGFTTTGTVSMTKTGGTATISGNINGAALTINGSGGTVNMGTGTHTFTGNVTLTAGTMNGGSSTINVNSTSATAWTGTGSVFSAGTSTVVFGGVAQTINTTTTFNNLTFAASGAKTIATGTTTTVNGILSREGTSTVTVSGTLTYGASATLQYKGTALQTTGSEFPATFSGTGGVIINNASGVTLNSARSLNTASKLTLTVGLFTTTATNLLTVLNTATTAIAGGSTTTFINGPVKWSLANTAGTYVFPVGSTGTNYFPFTLATTAASSPIITVQAFNADPGAGATYTSPIIGLSHNEYWLGTLNSGTFTGSVSLTRQVGLGNYSVIGKSTLLTGAYASLNGTVSAASLLNSDAISTLGYFNMSAISPCPTYALTGTTSSGICAGTPATVSVTGNAVNLPIGLYVVTYNLGSPNTATGLTSSMNVVAAGSGSFTTSNLATTGTTLLTITQITSGPCNTAISASNTVSIVTAVSSTPSLALSISSGTNPQCAGSSITYTATPSSLGGGSVSNYNFKVNGSTVQSGATATYTSSAMTNGDLVTCDVTVSGGSCLTSTTATSNTITMTVNPNFTPAVSLDLTTGTNPDCIGSTVVFTGTPSNYGAGSVSNYQFLVNGVSKQSGATTTYTTSTLADNDLVRVNITITGGTCVTATTAFDTTTMNISPLPAGRLTANGPFCLTGAGLLNYDDTLAVEPFDIVYSDGTSNRTSLGNSSGVDFATFTTPVTSTTIYTIVSVTDALGCVGTTGFGKNKDTITVNANNTVTRTSAAGTVAQTVCLNSAITNITYSTTGATGATFAGLPTGVNGSWLSNVITISGSPSVAGAATYTVTLTGGCGTITTTGSITVNVLPTVSSNVTPSATVCSGTSVTLTGTGASSYAWTGGITNATAFSATATTTYTVTGTAANGCQNTSTRLITVNALPTVSSTVSPSATVCNGTSVTLSGTGATSYAWTGSVTNATPFTATSTTTYTVTGTDANGCQNTATRLITVNALPTVSSTVSPSATVCIGTAVTLSGTGATSYAWTGSVTNATPFTATSTTTYTVTGTDANGCQNTSTRLITVNALPTVSSTVSPSTTVCSGTSVTLSGTGASSYAWTGGITNATPFTATSTTTYTVTGTDANGCQNTATTTISVTTPPSNSVAGSSASICSSGVVLAANTPTVGIGTWNVVSGPSMNVTQFSNIHNPASTFIPDGGTGNYTLSWTITNSPCTASSSSITLSVVSSGTWFGVNNDWFDANNWCGGIPTSTTNVVITSSVSNMPLISTIGAVCNSITINGAAALNMSSTSDLTVFGNWTNNGTFTSGGGSVSFTGSSAQTIIGTTTFDNMFVNNTAGVTLNNNIVINSILELDNGNISTGANYVQIEANAYPIAIDGFIDGNLKQYIPSGFGISAYYPIGSNSNASALDIFFNNVSTDGYVTASSSTGDHAQAASSGFNLSQTVNRTWTLTNGGISYDEFQVGMSYQSSDFDAGYSDSYGDLRVYTAGSWIDLPNSVQTPNYISASSVTDFGDYQIGDVNPVPSAYSISPSVGAQNQTLNITISGAGFISGGTSVNAGSGISVSNIVVSSDNSLTATIAISSTASIGQHSFSVTNIAPGGGTSSNLSFTVIGGLPVPNFIASNTTISCFANGSTTFNNLSSNATSYHWNFGSGANPATATGVGPYTVTYTSSGTKTVKLVATNGNGSDSLTLSNYITVNASVPALPTNINGLVGLCSSLNSNVVYSCPSASNATGYIWTLPSGLTYVSGQGTTAITVVPAIGFTIGSISVTDTNACGTNPGALNLNLSATPPLLTGSISGPAVVCGISTANYSVSALPGTSTFNWTVPSGVIITSGQGTPSILTNVAAGTIVGNITVQAISNCGSSATLSLTITKKPAAPSTIVGPSSLCGATSATLTTSSLGATSFSWTLPAGVTAISGTGTSSINVGIASTFVAGNVNVSAVNACGTTTGTALPIYVKVPAASTSIAGLTNLCGITSTSYTATGVPGATSYTWILPSGLSQLSASANNVTVQNTSYSSGNIIVQASNTCGVGPAKTLVMNQAPPTPGLISGPTVTCGITTASYSVAAVTGATSYTWAVPSGASIIAGLGTNSIVATWSTPVSGNVSVMASNACANSVARTLAINKVPAIPAAISGPTVLCTLGGTATFSIPAVTGATSYLWVVPSSLTVLAGQGTNSLLVMVPTTLAAGTIRVYAQTSCGNSGYQSISYGACASPIDMSNDVINAISLYPNPASNNFTLDMLMEKDQMVVKEVYDVLGNMVINEKHQLSTGSNSVNTNIELLSNGIYFVKILDTDGNTLFTQRLIKN